MLLRRHIIQPPPTPDKTKNPVSSICCISLHASLLQWWPFNKSIFNRDLQGPVHYWSHTGSSASVETPQLWFPSTKPAHYCQCEEPVGFIMSFPHYALKRPADSRGKEGTFGGKGGKTRALVADRVPDVKYDWLVRSGAGVSPLQPKSVSSSGTDCCERGVKTVVNTRRQILWLAGQAAAQVDCDSINKHPDTAGPCLAGYTCAYVRVCVGDAWNDGLHFTAALTRNIIQDDSSGSVINSFLNKRGTLWIWPKTGTSWVKGRRGGRECIAFRANVSSSSCLCWIMTDPLLPSSIIPDGLMWI